MSHAAGLPGPLWGRFRQRRLLVPTCRWLPFTRFRRDRKQRILPRPACCPTRAAFSDRERAISVSPRLGGQGGYAAVVRERAGAPGIWLRHVSAALRAGHAEWCCGERGRRLRLRPIGSPRPPTAAKGRDFVMNTKRSTTISTFAGALFGSLLVTTALTPVQGADMTQQLRV